MRLIFFGALLAVTTVYALWKGGRPERIVSLTFLIGAIVTVAISALSNTQFGSFELGLFTVDLAMLVVIVGVALNAERFWPLWLSAFQIFQVLSHFPTALIADLLPQTYLIIVSLWAYPMLLILFAGTVRHRQRLAIYGTDRSWSSF
jgi:hypothetical protein